MIFIETMTEPNVHGPLQACLWKNFLVEIIYQMHKIRPGHYRESMTSFPMRNAPSSDALNSARCLPSTLTQSHTLSHSYPGDESLDNGRGCIKSKK